MSSNNLPNLPEYRGRNRRETIFWIAIGVALLGLALYEWGPRALGHQLLSGLTRLWDAIPVLNHPVHLYRDGHLVTIHAHPSWARMVFLTGLHLVGLAILVAFPLVAVIGLVRWRLRRQRIRTMTWTEVLLFQNDVVTPDTMRQLFDQLWDALWPRSRWVGSTWWYRLFVSAPPFSLVLVRDAAVDDQMHWLLGIPAAMQDRVLAAWQNTYQNVRFHPWPHPVSAPPHPVRRGERAWQRFWATWHAARLLPRPPIWHPAGWAFMWRQNWQTARSQQRPVMAVGTSTPPPRPQVVRWRLKYRTAIRMVDVVSEYKALPLELLVQALAREAWKEHQPLPNFVWQATWTPMPTARALRQVETGAQYAVWEDNVAAQDAAVSALDQMGRGRWMTELRASAPTYDTMQRMVSAWGTQNRWAILRPHNVIVWRRAWSRWMTEGVPRIWPLGGGNPLWSGECAAFFALPTGRLRVSDLPRSMTRRMPAARALNRAPQDVIVMAEGHDKVGLYPADFTKNLLLLGIQGSGKSTSLINVFKNAVRAQRPDGTPENAVILFDIGKDTAQAALRLVPPDRTVLWVDPTDPENPWAIEPLDTTVSDAAAITQLLDTFQDIFGAEAIGPRSREILGHTLTAIIAASTPEHPRTLRDAYRFITDEGYRMGLLSVALKQPDLPPQTRDFWTVVLPQLLANNPRFWEEAVAAPRNKLDELLRHRAVEQALGVARPGQPRKRPIDWDRVIRERQVVIVNLDMAQLGGRSPVRLFGILITQLAWRAIQRQGLKPEEDRIPVRLLYDEAQEYLSAQFLDMLALGRAYGFQTVLATRFLMELRDPALQAGIINLCQNRIIHRIPEPSEAVRLMQQMLTIYINNITLTEEAQNLERFMADDIMRLPDHTAICLWQAKGAVQSPFVAETIDWRPDAHEDWATWHKAHQPEWLPPEEPEEFETPPEDATNTGDTVAQGETSAGISDATPSSLAPVAATVASPADLASRGHLDTLSPQALAQQFHLTEAIVLRVCREQHCTLSHLAQVLAAHHAERPDFMTQVPKWLSDHPEWFGAAHDIPLGEPLPQSTAVPLAPSADSDTPWLLDSKL